MPNSRLSYIGLFFVFPKEQITQNDLLHILNVYGAWPPNISVDFTITERRTQKAVKGQVTTVRESLINAQNTPPTLSSFNFLKFSR